MKIYVIASIILFFCLKMNAQRIEHFYPFVGFNYFSNTTINSVEIFPEKGIFYGFGLRYGFKNKLGLNLEPHINQFEFKLNSKTINASNINIPLNLSYKFNNYNFDNLESVLKLNEIMVGAYGSQFLKLKSPDEDLKDSFETLDYGLTAGITFRFLVFHFGVKYYHSLLESSEEKFAYKSSYVGVNILFPF